MTAGEINRLRVERLGLTQREFGALVGVDTRTVIRWEGGESSPTGPAAAVLRGVWAATFGPGSGAVVDYLRQKVALGGLGLLLCEALRDAAERDGAR